jgi:sugar phosphate isomerase/epimerase
MMWKKFIAVLPLTILLALGACAAEEATGEGWPLAVRLMSYGEYQDAAWTHLPEIGIRYLFMAVPAPEEADNVMKRLEEHGLQAVVVRGNTDLSKENAVDELAAQLAVCEKMGIRYMFLSAKRNDAPREIVLERLRQAGDIAQKHGVIITLETHPDLGTNAEVHLATMRDIDHPNVQVNFDTANITYYNRDADVVGELKQVMPYLKTIEFKDHNGEFETWNFPVLGQGIIDFPKIIEVLKEGGYQGPVTIEFEGIEGVTLDEEQTKQAIADSVAYLRTLATFR